MVFSGICGTQNLINAGLYTLTQLTFTCSKLTIETLEIGVKYVQSPP